MSMMWISGVVLFSAISHVTGETLADASPLQSFSHQAIRGDKPVYYSPYIIRDNHVTRGVRSHDHSNTRVRRQSRVGTSKLVIGVFKDSGATYKREDPKYPGGPEQSGYLPDLIKDLTILSQSLPSTDGYEYNERYMSDPGRTGSSGEWTGVMGQLVSKEVDMAGLMLITSERLRVVDFSVPILSSKIVMLGLKAEYATSSPSSHAILEKSFDMVELLLTPYSGEVWLIILGGIVVTIIMMALITRFNPYEWRALADRGEVSEREGQYFSLSENIWVFLGTMLWQGYTRSPRSWAARTLMVFWWTFLFITLILYVTIFASLMYHLILVCRTTSGNFSTMFSALKVSERPVEYLSDLANQRDISYGVVLGSSTAEYLSASKFALMHRLRTDMQHPVANMRDGVDKVRNSKGKFVLLCEEREALLYASKTPCDLEIIGQPVEAMIGWGLAFPRNSPLLDPVNLQLVAMKEDGKLTNLYEKWFGETFGECSHPSGLERAEDSSGRCEELPALPLDMYTYIPIIAVLVLGLILALLVCIIEGMCFKCCHCGESDYGGYGSPK